MKNNDNGEFGVTLVLRSGIESPISIILDSEELTRNEFIVGEATTHFERISGVRPVFTDISASSAPNILLRLDQELREEETSIKVTGESLVVAGGDARGIYYGLMEFLEFLGCRWFAPGEFGDVYPKLTRISVPRSWTFHKTPSMKWRGLHICGTGRDSRGERMFHYDYDTALWMIRNRMNFKPIHNTEYDEVTPILKSTLLSPLAFGHSYRSWIKTEEHDDHPEFSPLIAGKRFKGGQLCLSNENMRKTLVDRIVKFIDAHPELPVISLAPEDGWLWCECAECAELDSKSDIDRKELNRRTHLFSANIAAKVAERRPGKVVAAIAYCNYLEPADDVEHVDALGVSICVTRALNRTLNDKTSPTNTTLHKRLRKWSEKSGAVFWSEYFLSYGGTFPRAYYHEISATISQLVESGVSGFKSEVSPGNFAQWRSSVFFLYLVARTLYDVKTEPDALLADFCEKFYGSAASECEEYHKINQKLFTDSSLEFTSVTPELLPTIYSQRDIDELRTLVEKALKNVASGDDIFNERVESLKRQINEIANSRAAAKLADANSAIIAVATSERPTFEDFRNSPLTEQMQRKNLLPFANPNKFALKWTSTHLWIYFKLGEPDTRISQETVEMGNGLPFGNSNVDCFICPDPASNVYYQICVDIAGQFYSSKCEGRSGNPAWELTPEIELNHNDSFWELLLGLKYSELETNAPLEGKQWKGAFNRGQQCDSPATLGGWPGGGAWHNIEEMGNISMGGGDW